MEWLLTVGGLLSGVLVLEGAAAAGSEPTVQVLWADPEGLVKSPLRIREEVERQLGASGVSVQWEPIGSTEPTLSERTMVFLLRGSEPTRMGLHEAVMGVTFRGAPDKTAFIFLPAVARSVGVREAIRGVVTPVVSRAVGRVVAHEIIHRLAPKLEHDESGLMMERLNASRLLGDHVALDGATADALRRQIEAGAATTAGGDGLPGEQERISPIQRDDEGG